MSPSIKNLVGYPVVYSALTAHLTETERFGTMLQGSVHHPELSQFAGVVTRQHDDGTFDVTIFPPHRPSRTMERVTWAPGPGGFQLVGEAENAGDAPAELPPAA